MAKNLVIVESPAKAKTIAKYLNGNKRLAGLGHFIVMASMGHVRDLDKKDLSIDIDAGFVPNYHVSADKTKTVKELQKAARECSAVWLASDFDREGEGIAMHLREVLKLKNYKRITFTEITPRALEEAITHPRMIDDNLVDSQETRRMLDRIVGYKLSPVLWKHYKTANMGAVALSAGRVQSAVLHIILDREREIQEFASHSYWYFLGHFVLSCGGETHDLPDTKLYKNTDNTVAKENENTQVVSLLKRIKGDFKIAKVNTKDRKVSPDLPFITSTLQQEASRKLGLGLKRTMQIAQDLYEKGHITYMRTDSYNISEDFKETCQKYILGEWGGAYYSGGAGRRKTKTNKNAQEAHEAIRPTNVMTRIEDIDNPEQRRLYEMIWRRTVASFMTPCVYEDLEVRITDPSFAGAYHFNNTFSKVRFNGYMAIYGVQNDVYDYTKYITAIQSDKYTLTCNEITAKNTWASPPQRYADASIIRVLESESIGRPSTYSGIMTKLFEKQYVVKTDVSGEERHIVNYCLNPKKHSINEEKGVMSLGAERNKIVPTAIGKEIDEFLTRHFTYIVNKTFTASMEADLDKVAAGDKAKLEVLSGFWSVLKQDLAKVENGPGRGNKVVLKTKTIAHVINGVTYTIRVARYGPVIEWNPAPGGKKMYVNLKPYLSFVKKEMCNIIEEEVLLLVNLPRPIATVKGHDFMLAYGPYGFYGKWDGKNVKLPYKTIQGILAADVGADDLLRAIEYDATKKKKQTK